MAADSLPPRPPGMLVLPGGAQARNSASSYDEAEFLVGGKNKSNAELVPISLRLHEGYYSDIVRWILSKKFPYRSVTDLVRHALVRHLRYFLPALEGEVEGTVIHEMAQIDDKVARWRFRNAFVKQIEEITEEVNITLQMPGGRVEVERMLRGLRADIDKMKSSYQKGVYQKMFNERFGAYLQRPRSALSRAGFGGDDSGVIEFPISAYESFDDWRGDEEDE